MKKVLTAAVITVAWFFSNAQAATGWFQDYVLVSIDGGGNQYYWIGANPSFGTAYNGANFGSLNTLKFGADMKYWASGGDSRSGGAIYVSVNDGSFTEYIWTQSNIGGNDYQGSLPSTTIDVTAGLSPGTHKVEVYAKSWGVSGGDSFLSASPDYSASFTVVPEPSTYALLGFAAFGTAAHIIFRRRRLS